MRVAKFLPLAVLVFVVATLSGRAYAHWTLAGVGSGAAAVAPMEPLLPVAVPGGTAAGALYPSGTVDVMLTLRNPNAFSVDVVTVERDPNAPVESGTEGCGAHVSLQPGTVVLPTPQTIIGEQTLVITLPRAARMAATAPSVCQDATFTLPVIVTVRR